MSRIPAVIGAVVLSALIAACGNSSDGTSTAGTSPAPSSTTNTANNQATVALGTTNLGPVLVDDRGLTLYTFSTDTAGKPTCAGACLSVWPQVKVAKGAKAKAGDGVTGTLGTVTLTDGSQQVTIAGHPLYRYAGDTAIGQANGHGISSFGGNWAAVTASGTPVTKSGSTPSPTSTGSGGYSY